MDNLAAVNWVCEIADEAARLSKNNFADGRSEGRLREISGWVVTAVGVMAASRFPVTGVRLNSLLLALLSLGRTLTPGAARVFFKVSAHGFCDPLILDGAVSLKMPSPGR